jgi:3-oxoacyl-[acyl-carrier-protein] synthase-3
MSLSTSTRSPGSSITAWGHYQPPTTLSNDDLLERGLDSNDEWIRSRTGIIERHVATSETLLDMAEIAAQDALGKAQVDLESIDLVIFATCTALAPVPGLAAELASRLGLREPGAYDLNAACAGFVYALSAASDAILTGQAHTVLVVGAEKFSDWLDWTERSTAIIFADGAGAAIVTAGTTTGISPVVWGSDGVNAQAIRIEAESNTIRQDGQTVYRWATSTMGDVALAVCRKAGVDPSELSVFVPHQANLRIIELIAKKLGAQNAIIGRDVVTSGNTSAASIPMAMSKLLASNTVASGSPMLILGFGAGLTFAGLVVLAP